jgi:hypothetical protein
MKKSEKNIKKNEELILHFEISDHSSELVMRLESIIKENLSSQKLPTDFKSTENTEQNE